MNVQITKRTFVPRRTIVFAHTVVEEPGGISATELARQTKLPQSGPVHLTMMCEVDFPFPLSSIIHPCLPNSIDAIADDNLGSVILRAIQEKSGAKH